MAAVTFKRDFESARTNIGVPITITGGPLIRRETMILFFHAAPHRGTHYEYRAVNPLPCAVLPSVLSALCTALLRACLSRRAHTRAQTYTRTLA